MSLSPVTVHTVDVEENFRRIHQLLKGKTAHEVRDLTEALMAETVNLLYKVYLSRRSNSQSESRFLQIKDYIGVHITDDITIEKICEEFFISKSTLYRLFKNEMDISPTEYIKRLKIDIACKILKKTDIDINEISRQLGFYDNSHFFRTFSSIKGMSPSAYRRNAMTKPKV